MFWENSESVPHALRGRTFLAVLSHLKTLDLPDYCPILSRIKFWWFSFFLNLKTDLRKLRYQFFRRRTFAPKNLGGGTATFDFLHSDLFVIVYLVFLYLCVCAFVFMFVFLSFFVFVFICWWAAGSEWRRRRGERYFLNQIRKFGSTANRSITNHL